MPDDSCIAAPQFVSCVIHITKCLVTNLATAFSVLHRDYVMRSPVKLDYNDWGLTIHCVVGFQAGEMFHAAYVGLLAHVCPLQHILNVRFLSEKYI